MNEERTWRTEALWWLSCFLTLMAVLLPVAAGEAVYRALNTSGYNVDRFNVALVWTMYQPVEIALAFWPFFASGALGVRLLVPTFAGANPRVVASIVCAAPVVLGAWTTTLHPLSTFVYGGAAVAWGLLVPLPLKDVMAAGRVRGGLIVGLGLAAFPTPRLPAILWCCWRLYRDSYDDVPLVVAAVAALPLLLVVDNPGGAFASVSALYMTLETGLLLCLAIAAIWLGQFSDDEDAAETATGPNG